MSRRPLHYYDQDEVYYILEGELEVYCMGQVRTVRAGGRSDLPGTTHAFYLSPTLRFLALLQPGGLDGYFEAMSSPATNGTTGERVRALRSSPRHPAGCQVQVKMLTRETAELLPHYPGLGYRERAGVIYQEEIADRKDLVVAKIISTLQAVALT